jgi:hypothetical protein
MLVLDMIKILPPLGKYKNGTWRILPVKCYIDNSVRLWSCIRNVNSHGGPRATTARSPTLAIDDSTKVGHGDVSRHATGR